MWISHTSHNSSTHTLQNGRQELLSGEKDYEGCIIGTIFTSLRLPQRCPRRDDENHQGNERRVRRGVAGRLQEEGPGCEGVKSIDGRSGTIDNEQHFSSLPYFFSDSTYLCIVKQ